MLPPEAGVATVEPNGSIINILTNTINGQEMDGSGNGYGFVVGIYPNDPGTGGFSGLTAATDLGPPPISATTATMTGDYRLGRLDDLTLDASDRPVGTPSTVTASITLTADFRSQTLTGSDGDFSVDGMIDNGTLSGTVTYDGLSGTLMGAIGAGRALGHFAGSDTDTVYAGGFFARD